MIAYHLCIVSPTVWSLNKKCSLAIVFQTDRVTCVYEHAEPLHPTIVLFGHNIASCIHTCLIATTIFVVVSNPI